MLEYVPVEIRNREPLEVMELESQHEPEDSILFIYYIKTQADLVETAKKIAEESEFGLILMSDNKDVMKAGVEASAAKRPIIYAATADNAEDMGNLAKEKELPLAIKANNMDDLIGLSDKLTGMGLKDLILIRFLGGLRHRDALGTVGRGELVRVLDLALFHESNPEPSLRFRFP